MPSMNEILIAESILFNIVAGVGLLLFLSFHLIRLLVEAGEIFSRYAQRNLRSNKVSEESLEFSRWNPSIPEKWDLHKIGLTFRNPFHDLSTSLGIWVVFYKKQSENSSF